MTKPGNDGWTPFQPAVIPSQAMEFLIRLGQRPDEIWINNRYQVMIREFDSPALGVKMKHVSIKRIDKEPVHDWRDLQRIKNELLGADVEAVELYPSEARMVDTANQYHMWALPKGSLFPFGFTTRLVTAGSVNGSKQRSFDDQPADALSQAEIDHMLAQLKRGEP